MEPPLILHKCAILIYPSIDSLHPYSYTDIAPPLTPPIRRWRLLLLTPSRLPLSVIAACSLRRLSVVTNHRGRRLYPHIVSFNRQFHVNRFSSSSQT